MFIEPDETNNITHEAVPPLNSLEVIVPETVNQPKNSKISEIFEMVLREGKQILDTVKGFPGIESEEQFKDAVALRETIKKFRKEACDRCEKMRKPAYEAYQAILKERDAAISPFDQSLLMIDPPITAYVRKKEREQKEAEANAALAAKKLAEEAQLNAAESATKSGDHDKANAILNRPIVTPVISTPTLAKPKGFSIPERYAADENVDLRQLVEAVYLKKVPLDALQPNMPFLNGQARLLKDKLNYPGVTVVKKDHISMRGS